MVKIKYIEGGIERVRHEATISDKAIYRKELMNEEYVLLTFNTAELADLRKGDFIYFDEPGKKWGRFEIVTIDKPKLQVDSNGGYCYEQKFHRAWERWRTRKLFYNRQRGSEKAWSMTQCPKYFMDIVCENIRAAFGTDIDYSIDPALTEMKMLQFDGDDIITALGKIAEAWETEWWVEDTEKGAFIHLAKCEYADPVDFEIGGLIRDMERSDGQGNDYVTRLYAFGSTRNIPTNYRKRKDESEVVEGVVERRLMLPDGTDHIDAWPDMDDRDVVEGVAIFEEVYPRRVAEMSDISTVILTEEYSDDETDGMEFRDYTAWRYKDKSLKFKQEYVLPDKELHIIFQSGKLAGMDFEVIFNPDTEDEESEAGQLWEIVRNDNYGIFLPSEKFHPEAGDTFVLYGFNTSMVSDEYIPAAERELLEEAKKLLAKNSIDQSVYTCHTDPIRCAGFVMREAGWYDTGKVTDLDIGQAVKLRDDNYFSETGGRRVSRIRSFEKRLDNPYNATYEVGESPAYSKVNELDEKMESLILKGETKLINTGSGVYLIKRYDTTIPSDHNAYSAKRAKADFLSKATGDRTPFPLCVGGTLTAESDLRSKDFSSGLTGFGFCIDKKGNIEADSLKLRRFLEVPELRFNRTEVICGTQWRAPGGGIIESVDEASRSFMLKLEPGEIPALAIGDICMGIFAFKNPDGSSAPQNSTADYDDRRGNFQFAGFTTVYFTVMGRSGNRFYYSLRPNTSAHPCPGMHFVAYGNTIEPSRRTSYYATRTYERYLADVRTWEFGPQNVMMQMGDLTGLSIGGEDLSGYSAYLNNVFFCGTLRQIRNAPLRLTVKTLSGPYVSEHRRCKLKVEAFYGFDTVDIASDEVQAWVTVDDSQDHFLDLKGSEFEISKAQLAQAETITLTVHIRYKDLEAEDSVTLLDEVFLKGEDGVSYSSNLLKGTRTFGGWDCADSKIVPAAEGSEDGLSTARNIKRGEEYAKNVALTRFSFEADSVYTLSFMAKGTGRFCTYVHPEVNSETIYPELDSPSKRRPDTQVVHELGSDWAQYRVTFRTQKDADLANKIVLFRLDFADTEVWIKGIKLEKGDVRKPSWTPHCTEMTAVNGKDGEKGEPGEKGEAGPQGEIGPQGEVGPQGDPGTNGRDGKDGQNGKDGKDGANGQDGKDGQNGKDGTSYAPNLLSGSRTYNGAHWNKGLGILNAGAYDGLNILQISNIEIQDYYNLLIVDPVSLKPDTVYTVSFNAAASGYLHTYVYPDVNAEILTPEVAAWGVNSTDTGCKFACSGEMKRYSFSFRTLRDAGNLNNKRIVFRIFKGTSMARICGIKLEEGFAQNPVWAPSYEDMQGVQGPSGAVTRIRGLFVPGQTYWDGSTADADGVLWRDIVWVESSQGERYYYACRKGGTMTETMAPLATASGGNAWWQAMNSLDAVYTDLIFARNAHIELLSNQEMVFGSTLPEEPYYRIDGRIGAPLPDGTIMYAGGADTASAKYRLSKDGFARFGNDEGRRLEIDPTAKELRIYDDANTERVTIDGDAASFDRLYGSSDNLDHEFAAASGNASKTFDLGSVTIKGENIGQLKISVDVSLAVCYLVYEMNSGMQTVSKTLRSSAEAELQVIYNGSIVARDHLQAEADTFQSAGGQTYLNKEVSGKLSIDAMLIKRGTYSVRLVLDMQPESADNHTAPASFRCKDYISRLMVGAQQRTLVNTNGILVSHSTEQYLRAGTDPGGEFFIEMVNTALSGLKVKADGIYAKKPNGHWGRLKLEFDDETGSGKDSNSG